MKEAILLRLVHFASSAYVQSCPQGADCDTGLPQVKADSGELQQILQVAFGIIAAVAILFIIIGGLRYVISEGDPEATNRARGTIIYALVGLIIAISAEFLVSFVLHNI